MTVKPPSLEPLVKTYQVQAVYAAYLIVRDEPLAEDIVQTAFLHAAHIIHQFDAQRPFGPWFLRSVIHAAIKAARQQQRFVALNEEGTDGIAPSACNFGGTDFQSR